MALQNGTIYRRAGANAEREKLICILCLDLFNTLPVDL